MIGFHGSDKLSAVLGRHGFVIEGMRKESRRSVGGDLRFIGIEADEIWFRVGTKEFGPGPGVCVGAHGDHGIYKPGEIGPATQALDGIWRCGVAGIEMGGSGGSNVATGRKAEDTDAVWINLPRRSPGTGETDSAPGIEQGHLMTQLRQSILQDDGGDAVFIQPLRDGITLSVGDVTDVTAAGTNYDGGTICLAGRREEYLKLRGAILKLAVADGCFAGPESDTLGRCGLDGFGRRLS